MSPILQFGMRNGFGLKLNPPSGGLGNQGGTPSSPPTAAMGYKANWQALDGTTTYSDAGSTLCVNNDTCQQWNESLGVVASSDLAQATAGNRPTFKTGGSGSKSYLFFDGAGDAMANAITINNYMSVSAATITMVLNVIVGFTSGGVLLRDASSWFDVQHLTGNILRLRYWDTGYKTVDAAFTPGTPLVVSFKHDTGKIYSKVNAGAWSTGVTCGNRGGSTALNVNSGTGDCDLYAVALGDAVADADVAAVHKYYMRQLGL